MFKKTFVTFIALFASSVIWSRAIIDADVQALIDSQHLNVGAGTNLPSSKTLNRDSSRLSTIIFLNSEKNTESFIADLEKQQDIVIKQFNHLPLIWVSFPKQTPIFNQIAAHSSVMQISSLSGGHEELEYSEQAILLRPSDFYPAVSNWWDNGYTGQHRIAGILDSGIAIEHGSLHSKNIIIRKETGSGYELYKNGVRTPHGTGVSCIYAGVGNAFFPNDIGIAHDLPTIVSGLAGEGEGNVDDLSQTLSSLDWMLNQTDTMPDVINYSFGNGLSNCSDCPDWSGLAKVVDYVVNHYHILWVKSAGNGGYIHSSSTAPFASTMTSPADNYNGITVANMNATQLNEEGQLTLSPDRNIHAIRYTSSRGPTVNGRKKPDLSAPGNDTRTCAPDPAEYAFSYTKAMDYHDGYRLMGGTSAAAPHVGAAVLLLRSAGISSPMAQKALLINSADAYTDNGRPGPDDPNYPDGGGHHPVMGSEWNRTYGWGYLNMERAFETRDYLTNDRLTIEHPEKSYQVDLPIGAKLTLIHERRVGYSDSREWALSHLSLEIWDKETHQLIMRDDSPQDTVHQVANCQRAFNAPFCSSETKPIHALIKINLLSQYIDGDTSEPYALASSVPIH